METVRRRDADDSLVAEDEREAVVVVEGRDRSRILPAGSPPTDGSTSAGMKQYTTNNCTTNSTGQGKTTLTLELKSINVNMLT